MNKLMIRGAALFFLLMVSQGSNAIGWVGASLPCVSGGKGIFESNICDWSPDAGAITGRGSPLIFLWLWGEIPVTVRLMYQKVVIT
ncbi:hypothetical protein UA45_05480 [Morganella morganii]|uniref:Uncharacterized protein n=1 Tax=Morganella morganii TaxID=582 RepID=A0A0D8L9R5_MORMO|nr:hypothetical protein UA45_05480 [Morganella morganii]